jgi:U3 small nucleolar ribonucleoprotein protein IMP4
MVAPYRAEADFAAYEIRQGIDQTEGDVEWLLRPYMRTSKKRNQL